MMLWCNGTNHYGKIFKWDYKGKSKLYVCCPMCNSKISIRKHKTIEETEDE